MNLSPSLSLSVGNAGPNTGTPRTSIIGTPGDRTWRSAMDCGGNRRATPLWLRLRKASQRCDALRKAVKAPSPLTLCWRTPKGRGHSPARGVLECGGKRERHAALACVEATSQLEGIAK